MDADTLAHRRAADGSPRVCDSVARVVFDYEHEHEHEESPGKSQ
jgi:hypothetical protein